MFTSDCLSINEQGHLTIGECDTVALAKKYGTPLYVLDEDKVRDTCARYISSFRKFYHGFGRPIYASKAFSCKEICRIVTQEGLDIDVVSAGEIYTAVSAGVPAQKLHFHGNNKTFTELSYAIEQKVGDIVVDNLQELQTINDISREKNVITNISMRIKPGVDAHTHEFIRTGQIDSKFGFALETGEALSAVKCAIDDEWVSLTGLHCHIGSQVIDVSPFVLAAEVMLDFYAKIKATYHKTLYSLNLGGGFGSKYLTTDKTLPYEEYMKAVSVAIKSKCKALDLDTPEIFIEPGRSIVAEAGITLYTVGNVKEIPCVRNYVSIDGGMFENPRYALYQADHTCLLANKAGLPTEYLATVAGKCCESGDLIQENANIQKPEAGDIMAVLSTGAYNYSMASNYNRNPRPGCVMT
ncbi:MAG: diaminopimelate decarboxylase, partial [Oscillospiraceae bacterium]